MSGVEEEGKGETKSYKDKIPVGPPRLTDFEKARIIGIRAIQIQMGAPLFIDPEDEKDPLKIAEKELQSGSLPLSIKRRVHNREFDPIPVNWLLKAEKEDLEVEV